MNHRQLHLVIHHFDNVTTMRQADVAFESGGHGVFLISHDGRDDELFPLAATIKRKHPLRRVGVNLLQSKAVDALRLAVAHQLDMVWVDNPGVRSDRITEDGQKIADWLAQNTGRISFFGSVAFKYQIAEPDPGAAAHKAATMGMLPTTSGPGTGTAPDPEKIREMRAALGPDRPLAIASGITAENAAQFAKYATHFLVATGVSHDEHHLDPAKVAQLATVLRAA